MPGKRSSLNEPCHLGRNVIGECVTCFELADPLRMPMKGTGGSARSVVRWARAASVFTAATQISVAHRNRIPANMDLDMNAPKQLRLFRSHSDAELRFYDGYDPNFLASKGGILFLAAQHPDAFRDFVAAVGGNESEIDATVFHTFVSALHFSVLHQFEALFALLLAEFQDLPHWVFLTEYRTREIKTKAQAYIDHQYDLISAGVCSDRAEFITRSVYSGITVPEDMESSFRLSVNDIGWLIEEGAKRYLGSPEYNAYKHGLRVLPGAMTLKFGKPGMPPTNTLFSMPHSVTFLEREELDDGYGYSEVTKEVNAEDSYQWLLALASIAEAVRDIRLAVLRRTAVSMTMFTFDRKKLIWLSPITKFRVSL